MSFVLDPPCNRHHEESHLDTLGANPVQVPWNTATEQFPFDLIPLAKVLLQEIQEPMENSHDCTSENRDILRTHITKTTELSAPAISVNDPSNLPPCSYNNPSESELNNHIDYARQICFSVLGS